MDGLAVANPPFLSFPGVFKSLDGYLYYRSVLGHVRNLRSSFPFELMDSHFVFPDGVAAACLSERLGVPFTVTLRGTEVPFSRSSARVRWMRWCLARAARVISVSASLADVAVTLGCGRDKIRVIPNGVDVERFRPLDRHESRSKLGLPAQARVLLTVGGLSARKGQRRVIELLPELRRRYGDVMYVVVGGPSVEGDISRQLEAAVNELGLEYSVRFEGPRDPDELAHYYSAADLFVLATSNEGWANVLQESLACGTPVVTTDVGGNREVVSSDTQGIVVQPGSPEALLAAIAEGLERSWERDVVVRSVRERSWETVAERVVDVYREAVGTTRGTGSS